MQEVCDVVKCDAQEVVSLEPQDLAALGMASILRRFAFDGFFNLRLH